MELNRKMSNEYEVEIDQALQMARDFTGEGNVTPLQYPCLENPMDGGAWWATVHEVAKSRTQLSDYMYICIYIMYVLQTEFTFFPPYPSTIE